MSLTIEVADGLVLSGDAGPIEQIVFNLVDNAAKYGAGRVSIAAVARGAKVELRVRDEGKGVAVEVRARLFEPFSKSAELAAGGQPGVGLGLSLSRSLARAMGGELRLEPGEGGACFVLTLSRVE
jgi:signal transduction histidine kinase